jgi:hypothetical protein
MPTPSYALFIGDTRTMEQPTIKEQPKQQTKLTRQQVEQMNKRIKEEAAKKEPQKSDS